ncbi:hypothetical protein ACJX0J_023768 [Zea mays]
MDGIGQSQKVTGDKHKKKIEDREENQLILQQHNAYQITHKIKHFSSKHEYNINILTFFIQQVLNKQGTKPKMNYPADVIHDNKKKMTFICYLKFEISGLSPQIITLIILM